MTNIYKLSRVFQKTFDALDTHDVSTAKRGSSVNGRDWDSLRHMTLVILLEDTFGVTISIQQVAEITSYEAARDVIARLGIDFDK